MKPRLPGLQLISVRSFHVEHLPVTFRCTYPVRQPSYLGPRGASGEPNIAGPGDPRVTDTRRTRLLESRGRAAAGQGRAPGHVGWSGAAAQMSTRLTAIPGLPRLQSVRESEPVCPRLVPMRGPLRRHLQGSDLRRGASWPGPRCAGESGQGTASRWRSVRYSKPSWITSAGSRPSWRSGSAGHRVVADRPRASERGGSDTSSHASHPEEGSGALGQHGRAPEGAGQHPVETRPQARLPPAHLGSLLQHRDPAPRGPDARQPGGGRRPGGRWPPGAPRRHRATRWPPPGREGRHPNRGQRAWAARPRRTGDGRWRRSPGRAGPADPGDRARGSPAPRASARSSVRGVGE